MPRSPPAPLALVPCDADARGIFDRARANVIAAAVGEIEKVDKTVGITLQVLENIGVGLSSCEPFFDLETAKGKKKWSVMYLGTIKVVDPGMWAAATVDCPDEGAAAAHMMRMLRSVLTGVEKAQQQGVAGDAKNNRITVVTADEGDDSYMQMEVGGDTIADNMQLVAIMYGRAFSDDFVPKIAVLKRMMYCVKVEWALATLCRITLKSLRVSPSDTPFILLKRWCVGFCLVTVGAAVPSPVLRMMTIDSSGAGKVHGNFPVQWLSWFDCLTMLDTMEVALLGFSNEMQLGIVESTITVLAGVTRAGPPRLSGSAAMLHAARGIMATASSARMGSLSAKLSMDECQLADDGGERDPVVLGPNDLPKMKGGNPDGALCKDWAKGRCPRAKCSFRHGKVVPKKKKRKSAPEDEAAEEE